MTTCTTFDQLTDAFAQVQDGGEIVIRGVIDITPDIPTDIDLKPCGGAALRLIGKKNVTVRGEAGSLLRLTRHGSGIGLENCEGCHVHHISMQGQGYYLGQDPWYFAAIYLGKKNRGLKINHNLLYDHGDHGIAHLTGGSTDDSEFAYNVIERCGYLNHPQVGGDGTGIAVAGNRNRIHHNVIRRCFRALEQETKYADHTTFDNVWEYNICIGTLFQGFLGMPSHRRADLFARTTLRRNTFISLPAQPPFAQWNKAHPVSISGGSRWVLEENVVAGLETDWVAFDLTPDSGPIADCEVVRNHIAGGGSTGISIGESQGVPSCGIQRVTVRENYVAVAGRGIWYNETGHSIFGNTVVDNGRWEPIYSDDDKTLACCGQNFVA